MDNFTQLQIPLARQSQNLAPLRPLQDLLKNKKPTKTPSKFDAAIQRWYQQRMAENQSAWHELYGTAQLVAFFKSGQFQLARRPYGGVGWYVRPLASDDTYRKLSMNLMTFHAQVCEAKILASNPSVNIRAGDDTPQAIATAQACRPVVDCYETEWYTNKFSRREAGDFLTNGMIIERVRWNPFKGGQSVQTRQVNQVQKQTDEGYGECPFCENVGTASDFPNGECPDCQREASVTPPSMTNLSQISMGQSVPVGEPELIRTPLQGWRWELSKDLEDSPWAIYRQRVTQGAINMMLGDVVIPDSSSSDDYGLEILRSLSTAGQGYAGNSRAMQYGGGRSYDTRPTMAECWMPPEDQAEIECEEGDTICGVRMPAGKLNQFTGNQPLCLVGLNDMSVTVGAFVKETHSSEVVTGQWIMQSESGAGRGMEDTAAVQQRFNAADGQIYQGLAATATPAAITDLSIFKEDQANYLFRPGVNIDVNLALLPPNMSLKDAFYLPPAGNINPQYLQYHSQFLRQMMQISSFATEFTDGLIGVDNRTATGAQITAALANSLYAPMLGTKGQTRVRIAEMIVELYRAHNPAGRYFAGNGEARGRQIGPQDLKGKVVFELVQNSELPVTPFSQQTDVRAMVESLQGVEAMLMLKKQEPEMFSQLAAPFNYKPIGAQEDAISTLCLDRLEQMKASLKSGINNPAQLVQSIIPPVSEYEPYQSEKKRWWSKLLDMQQGQELPLEMRQAVEQMYILHQNYDAQVRIPASVNEGLVVGAGQAAALAPSALGQAAMEKMGGGADNGQAQELEHEQQQSQQEDEHEALLHMSDQRHETEMKDKEIEGQKSVAEIQSRTTLEATRLQGQNAIKVVKAKPKPRPTKAA